MSKFQVKQILFLILITALGTLNSCTTIPRDGPPKFSVDESKIPNATPKAEARSKYGNMHTYKVFGKAYHVLPSSENYEEQGVASWYGSKFHAHRTSNGERYDMLGMTAAHKTLPLPTYVQVTNLHNGKKVIVKVNDRGPFEGKRLIDLSYVAAKKLGMLGHGTTYVDVKAIDPMNYDKNRFNAPMHTSDFYLADNRARIPTASHLGNSTSLLYLQVGAFKNKMLAEHMKTRLHSMFSSPIKVTQLPADPRKLYRVQIGPLKDPGIAHRISQQLKALGLNTKQVAYRAEA
jgi:rare lipoprotein A